VATVTKDNEGVPDTEKKMNFPLQVAVAVIREIPDCR
jgi:hypothetical protein